MTLELAFATLEYGLRQLELKDGSAEVLDAAERMRDAFSKAKASYCDGQRLAAQRLLVSAENILKPVKVKPIVR